MSSRRRSRRNHNRTDTPPVLLAIGRLLGEQIEIEALLTQIVDRVADAMDADRATLFLIDRDRGELYSRVAHLPELPEIRIPIGTGIAGHVADAGEAVIIGEARDDRRFLADVDDATGYTTHSVLAVPVFVDTATNERRIAGVLQALNRRHGAFTDDDAMLLERLAEQIGDALSLAQLDDPRKQPARYNRIIGSSAAMRSAYDVVASAAATDATVLILGESGTGKELIARAIHINGPRAAGPFVKVDCTAIPEGLIEAELFGHEKGAFTGADRTVLGKCELASGGTLFLDEIGEMPLTLQAKLLRFVQDRELERVGGRTVIKADVRVIAATNRELAGQVERGEFRKDLFYRIKVVELRLPPLRERDPADIDQLARHFLASYARKHRKPVHRFEPAAAAMLRSYGWPGNIRELEHCIESAVVLSKGTAISAAHLSLPNDSADPADWDELAHDTVPSGLTLAEVERRYIVRTLAQCHGNRTRAAEALGIGRNTLVRKLKRYGVD